MTPRAMPRGRMVTLCSGSAWGSSTVSTAWPLSCTAVARFSSPVFPGDTPYRQQWTATLGPDCPVNVAAVTLSPHVGAHADAPLHYDPTGAAIGALDLGPYLGPCRVIHARGLPPGSGREASERLIRWPQIEHAVDATLPPRVLLGRRASQPSGG